MTKFKSNKKVIAQIIQLISALLAAILYLYSSKILDLMVENFLLASFYVFVNILLLPALIFIVQNIMISIVKIFYCVKNHLKLKSIDLSFLFIQCHPFHCQLMLSTNFIAANNLTTFFLQDLSEKIGFINVYEKYIIPFSRLVKIAMFMMILLGCVFLPYNLYYIFVETVGLSLYRIVQQSIDNDYDIINPMIGNNSKSYDLNLYRQLLIFCKTENINNKKLIYQFLKQMPFFEEIKYWQYNCQFINEMIFDSIIDGYCYIKSEDYQLYLSSLNPPVIQGLKLNTIDTLRYFAIYNKLVGNDEAYQEILADMRIQVTEIEYGEESVLKWFVNLYWRYINEIEEGQVDLLKDIRHDFYYYFDTFSQKRKLVSEMFNSLLS